MIRPQHRAHRFAAVLAAAVVAVTVTAAGPSLAGTPAAVTFSGVIKDTFGRNLVKPLCLFLWPSDPAAPGGWRSSIQCVDIDNSGKFSTQVAPGDYKVQVLADNVAEGGFVGGDTVATATVVTIPSNGLTGAALAIRPLALVTGTVTAAKPGLVNAQCVVFWQRDPKADVGWSASNTCGELNSKGAFTAYVPIGDIKIQVVADNVGSDVFLGGDNTLAGATVFSVPGTGLAKLKYTVPILPKVTGKVTLADGSAPTFPDSVFLWVPDATIDLGWSLAPTFWDINKDGTFTAYLAPGTYKFEFDYGKPKQRVYFGGSTPTTAMPVAIGASGASGLLFKVGQAAAPAGQLSARAVGRSKSVAVAWSTVPGAISPDVYAATATPGGATCTSTTTTCTITGLTDGQTYTIAVRGYNAVGSISAPPVQATAGPSPQQLIPETTLTSAGSTVGMTIANAPSGTSVKISGKPGVKDVSVKTDELGAARADVLFAQAGTVTVTVKTKNGTSSTVVYVPGVVWTTSVKAGKAAKFSVVGVPPSTTVNLAFSDGTTVPLTANAKGTVDGTASWSAPTSLDATATLSGKVISSAKVTVTK
ncbi:MAG: hypothetical protein KGP01_06500 [Actinomycetales bacterium]|nr:hypothetical protein [Actinomycetales bacterium]